MNPRLLGIAREKRFSPGKHAAGDTEILARTRAALERAGYAADVIEPEALRASPPAARVVFAMCQSLEALAILQQWEQQGVLVCNRPAAVRSCYRLSLVEALAKSTLPFPRSSVLSLTVREDLWVPDACLPESPGGWWIKRGDVHAMQPDDVVYVRRRIACNRHLVRLARRGIAHAVIQEHIVGQEVKFYAVRGHGLVHALTPQSSGVSPAVRVRLHAVAMQVADLLGLDVFGGDVIITPDDRLYLVDVNDWPSFRGCREEAAGHIARYVVTQAHRRGLL